MSNGTDSILPSTLQQVWDDDVARSFGKLSMDHQSFVLAYLANKRNAAKAYRESYKGRGQDEYAASYGQRIVSRDDVQEFLAFFKTSKLAALDKIDQVYTDAMEAEIVTMVEGIPIPGTERPDHHIRIMAAKEYAKTFGLNAPDEVTVNPSDEFRKLWTVAKAGT